MQRRSWRTWGLCAITPALQSSVALSHDMMAGSPTYFAPVVPHLTSALFYGSNTMWSLSAGMRFGFGMVHNRMGRYGAALPKRAMKMDGMDMEQ